MIYFAISRRDGGIGIKVLNRGISLDANPVMQSRLLKEIHCYDVNKYELQLRAFSENQQDAIRKFWNRYTPDIDIKWLQFYYTKSKKFDLRYIPHDVYYSEIDRILNPPYRALGLDDKRLYKRLFPGVKQPHILLSKIGRMIINDQGAILDLEKAMMECFHFSKVVCKEPINSCGGHSVECLYLPKDDDRLYELLTGEKDIIIQECITQHKELATFHSCSVNTIRLITYLRENGE